MTITARELETLVERLLSEGVPPGVVSRVLDLEPDLVAEAQKDVRIRKYGTDDLNDYMEQMTWDAVEAARTAIATGSAAEKNSVMRAILGKQMTSAAKRSPEGQRNQVAKVMEMFATMRGEQP
jgi:hypothetical protein